MSSILTSLALINTIRRRAAISRSNAFFSNDDFLEMATEEINLGLMDSIITARGDYLVYFVDVPMVVGKTAYPIPNRAHGNKLRDAVIIDSSGNVIYELAQTTLEEVIDTQRSSAKASFYMQNDSLILSNDLVRPSQSIRMWFYMRPNKLVLNDRAGTISQVSSAVEVDELSPLAGSISATSFGASTIVTSTAHGLTGGKIIITGTNSTPSIDGTYAISVIDANSFSVPVVTTVAGTTGSWTKAVDVIMAILLAVPKHFTSSTKYDVVGAESPNKIINFNLYLNKLDLTAKSISFRAFEAPALVVGDYVTKAEETIVPNIPTELHPIVAQRVAVACLESMGDEQNKQSAERKLAQMERAALKIIGNRVEGAPKKIKRRWY